MWHRLVILGLVCLALASCTHKTKTATVDEQRRPHESTKQSQSFDFLNLSTLRTKQFTTAAYLIDLRINDAGKKFSIATEAYFSGDSSAFYGRGYIGKGAFKGNIINDVITIYFMSENEYYTGTISELDNGADCTAPGEVLLYVFSLMSGRDRVDPGENPVGLTIKKQQIQFQEGRFEHTIKLKEGLFPEKEILLDRICQDSIVFNYGSHSREFPFYGVEDILYFNGINDFRAKGFVREQKYNIDIKQSKFEVTIPTSATLLDRI